MKADKKTSVSLRLLVSFVSGAVLAGCASSIKYTRLPPGTDPSKEIATLTQQLDQARSDQANFYAPESFGQAEHAYLEAKADRERDRSAEDILDDVAKSRAYLQQAQQRAKATQGAVGQVASTRTQALQAEAPRFASSREQFGQTDEALSRFARDSDREEGVVALSDKERADWIAAYKLAELHAVEQNQLGHARSLIQAARDEGASKLAPKSLAAAEAKYAESLGTIRRNPGDTSAARIAGADANQYAERLIEVTRLSKASLARHPEDTAAAQLTDEKAITELEQRNQRMRSENTQIQNEGKLGRMVKLVQSKFSPDEAQVFEDGKQVHIRLKGLTFSPGSSSIRTGAYPLLGKVQQVLKETQPAEVRIDGRTDSKGSKKVNQKLSKARAESVKEFLAASDVIDPSQVTTAGFDYQKPLAAEKTADGRSINRGIDVILVPAETNTAKGEESSPGAG